MRTARRSQLHILHPELISRRRCDLNFSKTSAPFSPLHTRIPENLGERAGDRRAINQFLFFRERENDQRSGMTGRVGKGVGMGHRYSLGARTGLSQEHNQCLVTDTSAAGSSSRPAARDVRDDPSRAPREAHTRLGFCTPARASPAHPPPQDLLRRAGPVNRGAVRGRVQLDGRRLLLGHFGPRKGAPNSEGGPSSFLPLSCPAPASRGQVWAASPKAAFGGRALRGPVKAKGPVAVWGNPRPTCSVHREPKGFPAGAARQPGIPSRSPSVNRSRARAPQR